MNAHTFVLSLADRLLDQGRSVEYEEEPDSIRIIARARVLAEDTLMASAYKSAVTGRWNFQGLTVFRVLADPIRSQTRRDARIAVEVYGTSAVGRVPA